MEKEYIDLSHQREYDANEFRSAIADVQRLIRDILRLSGGCEMDPSSIANRAYVLDWLMDEVEIKDVTK